MPETDTPKKPCTNPCPSWFTGHWRDWHRGHGCAQDDGNPRSPAARTEIDQHAWSPNRITDAQVAMLRARTTSGDTEMCKALDELKRLRAACSIDGQPCFHHHDVVHGKEAEQLRRGIEALLTAPSSDYPDVREISHSLTDLREGLRKLLDNVDACDSLAFVEKG